MEYNRLEQKFNILVITDDENTKDIIFDTLGDSYQLKVVSPQYDVNSVFEGKKIDLIIADSSVSKEDLTQLSEKLKRDWHRSTLAVLVEKDSFKSSPAEIDAFLEKPIDPEKLGNVINKAQQRKSLFEEVGLIGRSEKMEEIFETIFQIAPTNVSVLVSGESGTGKELIAKAIHYNSPRKFNPFLPVNCGALAEGVLESELFGHEKGAFTGATSRHKGIFESAHGGTVLLDEIGEMPLQTQVKLLRVLEEQTFLRVGGTKPVKVDVRVIALTNKDLAEAVRKGEFRKDLYYRIKVIEIVAPPLRERKEDLPLLINAFIQNYSRENNLRVPVISKEAIETLMRYHWPGNVRELENLIKSILALSPKQKITSEDIPEHIKEKVEFDRNLPVKLGRTPEQSEREIIYRTLLALREDIAEIKRYIFQGQRVPVPIPINPYETDYVEQVEGKGSEATESPRKKTIAEMEKEMIRQTLKDTGGNRKKTAKILGIGERTLYRKIKDYGLEAK